MNNESKIVRKDLSESQTTFKIRKKDMEKRLREYVDLIGKLSEKEEDQPEMFIKLLKALITISDFLEAIEEYDIAIYDYIKHLENEVENLPVAFDLDRITKEDTTYQSIVGEIRQSYKKLTTDMFKKNDQKV